MTPSHFTFTAHDEADTERLGQALARVLPPGSVVALHGALGAGKTRLVQALATACGVERREVVSPTFVLVHEYQGDRPIYHIDAYRLRDQDEFLQLGPDEYFEGDGLVLVEWADRVIDRLPADHLRVEITATGATTREFNFYATGPKSARIISRLAALEFRL